MKILYNGMDKQTRTPYLYVGFFMHHKDIKLHAKKQIKKQYPNWKHLTKKEKRALVKKAVAEVIKLYNFNQPITNP